MSKIELKPCPFCGGEAQMHTWREEDRRVNPTIVFCTKCRAQTNLFDRIKDAAEAWNRRAE